MTTIKSYTDLSQSKKLAEILPLESADMYIYKNVFFGALSCFNGTTQVGEYIKLIDKESKAYPCWSLAALLSIIPNYKLSSEHNYHSCAAETSFGKETVAWFNNSVDACVEMILKLYELNLL